ncbi:RNA polymerase sporulation sigma factor SigH [Halanaerobacter jeridensis]|uniref:RNA polymerase sporulation-specific sigma factor n=1 Tax=Halanaerobacter jeridensis TaxID=706427 RepID=A0A938XTY1_9FIRM|nr:RNA polymerase sporulation sigma factor SigH [Halanaerobacter jeridensis]MBM7557849.1 RNA polymerase sporulation-specific sigma factor [Halanaerobacter jeridensis]
MNAKLNEYSDYRDMTDDEVVDLAQEGNALAFEYLIKKYKNFVKARSNSYFLIGADSDDIVQEGMIGLYKAIRDYKKEELASFFSFAELCITRQIITAIKTATRQKHQPLNSYVSLDKPIFHADSNRTLLDVLEGSKLDNPERLVVSDEIYDILESNIQNMLSELELKVLQEYLKGRSYQDIANSLGRHVKSVDNALQRVKKKLEDLLEEKNI